MNNLINTHPFHITIITRQCTKIIDLFDNLINTIKFNLGYKESKELERLTSFLRTQKDTLQQYQNNLPDKQQPDILFETLSAQLKTIKFYYQAAKKKAVILSTGLIKERITEETIKDVSKQNHICLMVENFIDSAAEKLIIYDETEKDKQKSILLIVKTITYKEKFLYAFEKFHIKFENNLNTPLEDNPSKEDIIYKDSKHPQLYSSMDRKTIDANLLGGKTHYIDPIIESWDIAINNFIPAYNRLFQPSLLHDYKTLLKNQSDKFDQYYTEIFNPKINDHEQSLKQLSADLEHYDQHITATKEEKSKIKEDFNSIRKALDDATIIMKENAALNTIIEKELSLLKESKTQNNENSNIPSSPDNELKEIEKNYQKSIVNQKYGDLIKTTQRITTHTESKHQERCKNLENPLKKIGKNIENLSNAAYAIAQKHAIKCVKEKISSLEDYHKKICFKRPDAGINYPDDLNNQIEIDKKEIITIKKNLVHLSKEIANAMEDLSILPSSNNVKHLNHSLMNSRAYIALKEDINHAKNNVDNVIEHRRCNIEKLKEHLHPQNIELNTLSSKTTTDIISTIRKNTTAQRDDAKQRICEKFAQHYERRLTKNEKTVYYNKNTKENSYDFDTIIKHSVTGSHKWSTFKQWLNACNCLFFNQQKNQQNEDSAEATAGNRSTQVLFTLINANKPSHDAPISIRPEDGENEDNKIEAIKEHLIHQEINSIKSII